MLSSSSSARDLTFERETKYLEGFRGVSEQSRAFPGSQTEARWIRFFGKKSYGNQLQQPRVPYSFMYFENHGCGHDSSIETSAGGT